MGLTSKKVLLLAVVLAVLLFAATVWLWPRLARRGVLPVLGRVAVLLATQASLIAALGLGVNSAFGFYASWADLFGEETAPGVVVNHAGAVGRAAGPDAAGALQVLSAVRVNAPGGGDPRLAGRIEKVAVRGARSGIATTAYIYLPPEYFRQPERHFPAAVVLTGYPGTAEALFKKMRYPAVWAAEVRHGQAQPTVLVMLRPTVAPPRDTECVDVPGGPQTETFFARDLRAAVLARYRVGAGPASWGVIGDSTGGYCALRLALRDPQAYSVAVGLSADYAAPLDATTGDLFGGSVLLRRQSDLVWRLRHLPQPRVSLLVTSSRHGERNFAATLRFVTLVKAPARVSSIILDSGGHNFTTWSREIPPALRWMSARLRAERPDGAWGAARPATT